jgi:hypothetical protein
MLVLSHAVGGGCCISSSIFQINIGVNVTCARRIGIMCQKLKIC